MIILFDERFLSSRKLNNQRMNPLATRQDSEFITHCFLQNFYLKMFIPFLFFIFSVNACSKKQEIHAYKCAYGNCIENPNKQPNGNKLCKTNYPSIDLALENCDIHRCEKIAQYKFQGKGNVEY